MSTVENAQPPGAVGPGHLSAHTQQQLAAIVLEANALACHLDDREAFDDCAHVHVETIDLCVRVVFAKDDVVEGEHGVAEVGLGDEDPLPTSAVLLMTKRWKSGRVGSAMLRRRAESDACMSSARWRR